MFNTLKFAKDLEATGMTREQAETFTENLSEMVFSSLATKTDLDNLDRKLTNRIDLLDEKMDRVEERLNNKIDQAVNKLTIKLGSLLAIGLGVMSFVVKFSH